MDSMDKPKLIVSSDPDSDVEVDCVVCSRGVKAVIVTNSGCEVPLTIKDCPRERIKQLKMRDALGNNVNQRIIRSRSNISSQRLTNLPKTPQNEGEGDKPGRRKNLKDYRDRLSTFYENGKCVWPIAYPSAEQLANQGFSYRGQDTIVECCSCSAKLTKWNDGKDPLLKHFTENTQCPFLLKHFQREIDALSQQLVASSRDRNYANASLRIHSFENWPISHIISSYPLSTVGFYYTGRGTEVCCFSCGVRYNQWKPKDIPLIIHKKLNPDCPFLKELLSKDSPPPLPLSSITTRPTTLPPQPTLATTSLSRPDYSDENVRIESFKHLPQNFPCSKQDCARAGLYFLRRPDVLKCFTCNVVVQGWVPGDTAVEKHREVSPQCEFLQTVFPTKLSSSPSDDPSALPEPSFSRQELLALSRSQSVGSTSAHLHRLSLSDSQPTSLPSRPQHSAAPWHSRQHSTFVPSSSYHPSLMPRPRRREEYAGPMFQRYSVIPSVPDTPKPSPNSVPAPSFPPPSTSTQPPRYAPAPSYPPPSTSTQPPSSSSRGCVVCMDAPLEMVLMPCRHICVCENCSSQLRECPLCRQYVDDALKVYLPY